MPKVNANTKAAAMVAISAVSWGNEHSSRYGGTAALYIGSFEETKALPQSP
jgi:hypothetical protein